MFPLQIKVKIQDFLQVFQGGGKEKMEDNSTSADPLSYTTNASRVDQGARSERLLPLTTPTPQLRIINIDRQTGKQFII